MQRSRHIDPAVADQLDKLAADGSQPTSWDEVRDTVEQVLATVEGDITGNDLKLFAEVRSLASYIEEIRNELADLQPEQISQEHIPTATDELDAVVHATEEATNSIMAAAETIENVAEMLDRERSTTLTEATTQIYEACSFQDITGQRISKVVGALKAIELKVAQMIETFGGEAAPKSAPPMDVKDERASLEGPQLPADANSQDDIDALLASFE